MRLVLVLVVGALVIGCSGRAPRTPGNPQSGSATGWFCQMNPDGDGWDCVRDDRLAREPQPERLPSPPEPAAAAPMRETPAPVEPRTPTAPPPAEDEVPDDVRVPAAPAPDTVRPADADPSLPDYLRLAYRPPRPMALTELPGEFYAVQLVAMSSKPALERYVEREGISGMSAARVERNGELFYVLILGIYETTADARRAVASLPAELEESTPWIRPLGSLQAAMLRADDLAGSSRY